MSTLAESLVPPPIVRQLAKFAAVGASNTLLSFVVFWLLVALRLASPAAAALGFAAGAANGYVWNGLWTFATRGSLARYVAVQGAGLGATAGLVWIFEAVGLAHLPAYALTVGCVTCVTFAASRTWVFRPVHAGRHR